MGFVERSSAISFAADVVERKSKRIFRVPTGFPREVDDEHAAEENEQDLSFAGILGEHACDGSQLDVDVAECVFGRSQRIPAVAFDKDTVEHTRGRIRRVPTGYLHPTQDAKTVVKFDTETVEPTCRRIRRVPTGYLHPTEEAKTVVKFDAETVEPSRRRIRRVPTGYLYPTEEAKAIVKFDTETVEPTCRRIRRVPTGYLHPIEEARTVVKFDAETVEPSRRRIRRVPTGYLYPTEEAKALVSFDAETVEHTLSRIRRVPTGFLHVEDMPSEDRESKQELEVPATLVRRARALWRDALPPSDEGMPLEDRRSKQQNRTLWRDALPPCAQRCNRTLWRDALPPSAHGSVEHTLQVVVEKAVRFEEEVVDRSSGIRRVPTPFLHLEEMASEQDMESALLPSGAARNRALWRDAFPPVLTLAQLSG